MITFKAGMSKPTNKRALQAWLDKIQQDSWQLELIISGFAIFLLIGSWQPIMDFEYQISLLLDVDISYALGFVFYQMLRTGYQALLFCLLVHLVLRGLWIAAIGLRSVSGDIDYEALRYQQRFDNWLKKRIGSFDDYVERLEKYCSLLFSLAFLILFCFLSLATFSIFVAAIQMGVYQLFKTSEGFSDQISTLNNSIGYVFLLGGFVYLIDFFSFGFFKRNRFTARPYYFLYRTMGWLTLARFYRPLYYNLIDQGFGRKIARFLPVFIVGILAAVSVSVVKYSYFPQYPRDGEVWIDHLNYDDTRIEPLTGQSWRTSLNSKYVENNYVEVFVPYLPVQDDEVIKRKFPDLAPARYRGIKLNGAINLGNSYNEAAQYDSLLLALTGSQRLFLNDSLLNEVQPRFHFHEKRLQPGLLYMLPTHDLRIGEHQVRVEKERIRADTLYWSGRLNIHFYK